LPTQRKAQIENLNLPDQMLSSMKTLPSLIVLGIVAIGIQTASAAFYVDFYLSAPGVQTSFAQGKNGTATEDFNSFSGVLSGPGTLSVGNYTGGSQILPGDQWGGANGSKYVKDPSPLDITFTTAAKYVGFWWSAGNGGNTVNLYSGGSRVAEFTTTYLSTYLNGGSGTVTALDGTTYNTSSYYGNPNGYAPQTPNEPYGYINLFARNGAGFFDRVVFSGGGFEFDNITVSSSTENPLSSIVGIGSVNSDSPTTFSSNFSTAYVTSSAVPEPGQVAASLLLLAGIGGYVFLKRRKAAKPVLAQRVA
jgi:hypothetical protein